MWLKSVLYAGQVLTSLLILLTSTGVVAGPGYDSPYYASTIPGAQCSAAGFLDTGDIHGFRREALVNTESAGGDLFFAKCVLSEFAPDLNALEFRLHIEGEAGERPVCFTVDAHGDVVPSSNPQRVGDQWRYWVDLSSMGYHHFKHVVYCSMLPGASLKFIDLIWQRR